MKEMKPKYDHLEVEQGKYDKWLKKDIFKSGVSNGPKYTIVIPPPNVTGILHIGHAYDFSLQDIIIRRKRMQGYDALYLPGMDHAGIATQAKVDKRLKDRGINKSLIGREKFLEYAWEWKEEYAKTIRKQWGSLGLSLDYSKERFTLDDNLSKTVQKVFKALYDKGLIYHGTRMVIWDIEENTALSDIEIEHIDTKGSLWYIKYPLVDGSGEIVVATTRPETMFADQAVMVNPEDDRYKSFIGKMVHLPLTNRVIPIIEDSYVDISYGTGAVKVTPAHDPNDYEVGLRHKLEMPECIDKTGKMTKLAGKYEGLDRFECRDKAVEELKEKGYLLKIEEIVHAVGFSERTHTMIEPRVSLQWFVKMRPLADQALKNSNVKWWPERFYNTWKTWMDNVEDWCISRQLWWGHRIPVYYRGEEVYCGDKPSGDGWVQDEDVLDTWFSSALWPFSTLDWYNNSKLFNDRYPTDCLVTGYDIIFFWVSRMIFQSEEFTKTIPFKDVVIHGLIRDSLGRKMSKSLGNGIDPMQVIETFGADTLRYFISTSATLGQDLNYNEEKVKSTWNYLNKIWNVSRYILSITQDLDYNRLSLDMAKLSILDKWMLTKINTLIEEVDKSYERYDFVEASKEIYDFLYDSLASIYVELSKIDQDNIETKKLLTYSLVTVLKLLQPICPFITDDIYSRMYDEDIALAKWPEVVYPSFKKDEEAMELIIDLIKKVRTLRADYKVSLSKPLEMNIVCLKEDNLVLFNESKPYLTKFLNPEPLHILSNDIDISDSFTIVGDSYKVYIPLSGLIDKDEKLAKLRQEYELNENEIKRSETILSNPNFTSKAPKEKVDKEKEKYKIYLNKRVELLNEIKKTECL